MTGRERLEAAFSPDGARDIGAVICYEDIYIRDRWDEITSRPWWYQMAPDVERQIQWRTDYIGRTGLDWIALPQVRPRAARERLSLEERARLELQENAIQLARERPDDVAQLLRTWLAEE